MTTFSLSEKQAQAILDMRLQRLTGLERDKIEDEYQELVKLIAELKAILADNEKILEIIREGERTDTFPLIYHNNPEFHEKTGDVYLNQIEIGMNERPRQNFLDRYFRPTVDYLDKVLNTKWLQVVVKNETRIEEKVSLDKRRAEESKVRL